MMIHSKYTISHIKKIITLLVFVIVGFQSQTIHAQDGCTLIDTVCTSATTDMVVADDGSTYTWSTDNGATLTPSGANVTVDWSTSTVVNGLDSVCVSTSATCIICRTFFLNSCCGPQPLLIVKRVGAETLCEFLAANPTDPIGSEDCDAGGQDNLTECNEGQDPENPADDCVPEDVVKATKYVVWARTGALSTLDPSQCIDDIDVNWGTIGTWTQTTSGNSALTFSAGTNSGSMICDNTATANIWENAYNSSLLPASTSGCVSFTITEDEKSGHFQVCLTEEQSQIDGTWGTAYCQIYVDGNTQINAWRVTSVAPGFPANPFSYNSGWQYTGWTFPMSFDICIDATSKDYYVNKDGAEVARVPLPFTTTTCP